tara:strand:- start:809 stop:2632 length:1824 start_codon:yes stop_codon:yes gene_type:complete
LAFGQLAKERQVGYAYVNLFRFSKGLSVASGVGAEVLIEPIVYLGMAGLVVPLARRLGLNEILTFLLLGVIIGPGALGQLEILQPYLITNTQQISLLADLGVIFLMFTIGLELSPTRLYAMRRLIGGVGGLQIVITTILLTMAMMALGFSEEHAILFGMAMSLSSTAMVMHLLSERRALASPLGRANFGVLLAQDLAVIPLLFAVSNLASDDAGTVDFMVLGLGVGQAIIVVIAMYSIGRLVARPFLVHSQFGGRAGFMAIILLIMFAMSAGAELGGLSASLGALLAGLVFASTASRHQIEADIEPFKTLLLGLFFLTSGMLLPLSSMLSNLPLVLLLIVIMVVIKIMVIGTLMLLFKQGRAVTVESAFLLAPAGEFAFVLLATASSHDVINQEIREILLAVALISMMTLPIMAKLGGHFGKKLHRDQEDVTSHLDELPENNTSDVLLLGIGRVGKTIAEALEMQNIPYIAVDNRMNHVREARREGIEVFFGEARREDFLMRLQPEKRQVVVIALDDPPSVYAATRSVRKLAPNVRIITRSHDEDSANRLRDAGASMAIPDMLGSSLMISEQTLRCLGLPQDLISSTQQAMRLKRAERLNLEDSLHD